MLRRDRLWDYFLGVGKKNYEAITLISKMGILFENDYFNVSLYDQYCD